MAREQSRVRLVRGCVLAASVVLSAASSGCGGIPPEPFVVADAAARSPGRPPAVTAAQLDEPFRQFLARHPDEISIAWSPVGSAGPVQVLGRTTDSDAWSTMKVPIAIAALTKAGGAGQASKGRLDEVRDAIEWSDNDAAAELYASLGPRDTATEAVEAVLRAGGDTRTQVGVDQNGKAGGFGRSVWRVDDAATFASRLPCLGEAGHVYDEMSKVGKDHRWGLGALSAPVRFKGGWGPSDHGYLMRQIGTIEHHGGRTAIALVVHPADGTHRTGAATASALAAWFAGHLGPADAGSCPAGPPAASASP